VSQPISIMPCLDMQNGRVVKGVHFVDIRDAGDPVQCAAAYCRAGADELAMLDITATVENRGTLLDVVRRVAEVATVPFTVGGGIRDLASAAAVIEAGADRVSVSSAAFRRPEVIGELVREFGGDRVTVAIDVDRNPAMPSGDEVRARLQLPARAKTIRIRRLRGTNKVFPMVLLCSEIPAGYGIRPGEDFSRSLYELIERKHRIPIVWGEETIEAATATAEQAGHLRLRTGDTVLVMERVTYTHGNQPVEFVRAVYRPDRYKFSIRLSR